MCNDSLHCSCKVPWGQGHVLYLLQYLLPLPVRHNKQKSVACKSPRICLQRSARASSTVISLTPSNTDAIGFYRLWHGPKAHSPTKQSRDKSSNSLGLAVIRLLCCEHLDNERKPIGSGSHSRSQSWNVKLGPFLLQ